jgi:hypothetical protein
MNNLYHKVTIASVCTALGFVLGASPEAKAASFIPTIRTTISYPTFTVTDLDSSYYGGSPSSFDGLGDLVSPHWGNYVINGTLGEAAQITEINIYGFFGITRIINSAILQAKIGHQVSGLGVGLLDRPSSLGVFGFVGNGKVEASDFEAGVLLSSVDISSLSPGDIINFDVTRFANQLARNNQSRLGFSIRALNFGGLTLGDVEGEDERISRPTLILETSIIPKPEPVPEPTTIFGSVIALGVGGWLKRKKSSQQNKTKSKG